MIKSNASFEPLRIQRLGNRILEGIPLPKLIIIMLRLIPLLQIQIVVPKEVIVILRANDLHCQLLLHVLVGVVVGGLILTELVVVVFIVEVF